MLKSKFTPSISLLTLLLLLVFIGLAVNTSKVSAVNSQASPSIGSVQFLTIALS